MKKHTAGITLAAAVGFSAVSATPAIAMAAPYPNCAAAEADGVYNLPSSDPRFGPWLDADNDGYGCDDPTQPTPTPTPTTPPPTTPPPTTQPPTTPEDPTPTRQMTEVPRGGVDAGVATESSGPDAGTFVLAGALVLVAAGAGTYAVRRRDGDHA